MAFTDLTVKATDASVNGHALDVGSLDLPPGGPVALRPEILDLGGRARIDGTYVYSGTGSAASPALGDSRITYAVIAAGTTGTVFGRLDRGKIVAYRTPANDTLYHWRPGDRDSAIAALHGEYVSSLWIFRLVGFLMMWFGLMMLLAPLGVVLDVVPLLGSLGKLGIAL